ncbi:hypothetical protein ABK040_005860 [Willaertia magna]
MLRKVWVHFIGKKEIIEKNNYVKEKIFNNFLSKYSFPIINSNSNYEEIYKSFLSNNNNPNNHPDNDGNNLPLFFLEINLMESNAFITKDGNNEIIPLISLKPLYNIQKRQQTQELIFSSKQRNVALDFLNQKEQLSNKNFSKSSALIKACSLKTKGMKDTVILDATTGLAKDSFTLSQFDFRLIWCERHPIISLLLENAMKRAQVDHKMNNILHLFTLKDCKELTNKTFEQYNLPFPDVIYLDPMFPSHTISSALPKYELQVLRELMIMLDDGPLDKKKEDEEGALLDWALGMNCAQKVILKRPSKAPTLLESKIIHSFTDGKSDVRFDMYFSSQ